MKVWLTNATKKRVIDELRKILYDHPRYREDSENVQNKYSFEERPQRGIIVNGTSADRVRLSADNYIGRLNSFVMQVPVENAPGTTLEWVRENQKYLDKFSRNRSVFPSPPGAYILNVLTVPDVGRSLPGSFTLDPILAVTNEPLIQFTSPTSTIGQLTRQDVYPGSVRLWLDGRQLLVEGTDYTIDDNIITFLKTVPSDVAIYADYNYQVETQGPFPFSEEMTDLEAIPGAILAFGDRPQACDKIAIVVNEDRVEVAEVYGGKFEVHFDLIVFSRDSEDREKLSDYVVVKLLERQNILGFEGLELIDVAPGGENEEIYNATLDAYYYDGAVALSMRVDWEVYVPLPIQVFKAAPVSKQEEQQKGVLDGSYTWDKLRAIEDPSKLAGISAVVGKDLGYERVR